MQKFNKSKSDHIKCSSLNTGELGEVMDKEYDGVVIVRTFGGYVCVHGNDETPAFVSTWNNDLNFMVRKLDSSESVVLTNG